MELPKNITQIGEVGKGCKVYVEDYVVSYLKQLNGPAGEKQTAAALYGKRRAENGVTYYFLYGACRLDKLQAEVRHLSQAQLQEIERLRVRFFPELEFLGYRILNGEMIEGFHIREQEICRYLPGYAQFYEKNDGMLAYMLSIRDEIQPEQFDQTKYIEVRKRQEERRAMSENASRGERRQRDKLRRIPKASKGRNLKAAAAGVFVLLCVLGLVSLQDGAQADEILQTAGETLSKITSGKTLTMEPRLDEALLEENQAGSAESPESETQAAETAEAESIPESTAEASTESTTETSMESTEEAASEPSSVPEKEASEPETEASEPETASEEAVEASAEVTAVAYVIRSGDTLSAISLRQYGSEKRVTELCEYNGISDPDDIKEGQIIMLPQ